MRRFPEALATLDRALAWAPTNNRMLLTKAEIFMARGDLEAAEPLLALPDVPAGWRATYAMCQRRYPAAVEILSKELATERDRDDPSLIIVLGQAQGIRRECSSGRANFQKAVQDLKRQLENVVPGSGHDADTHALLGLAHAHFGEATSAIAEGQKAMAMEPGRFQEHKMAEIYAVLGDADHAIPMIKPLLQIPYSGSFTPAPLDSIRPMTNPQRSAFSRIGGREGALVRVLSWFLIERWTLGVER